ncbi:MAG: hypothetical protein R3208_12880 [Ketobacteraceae bacterium]|nr:hypothetical protein [Ketobacteraceae bacterium]
MKTILAPLAVRRTGKLITKAGLLFSCGLILLASMGCGSSVDCDSTYSNVLVAEFCKDGKRDGSAHWNHDFTLTESEHSDHFWDKHSEAHISDNSLICIQDPDACGFVIDIEIENAYKLGFETEATSTLNENCVQAHCRKLRSRWAKGLIITGAVVGAAGTLTIVGVGVVWAYGGVEALTAALAEFGISATATELGQMGIAGATALEETGFSAAKALELGLAGDTGYLSTVAF